MKSVSQFHDGLGSPRLFPSGMANIIGTVHTELRTYIHTYIHIYIQYMLWRYLWPSPTDRCKDCIRCFPPARISLHRALPSLPLRAPSHNLSTVNLLVVLRNHSQSANPLAAKTLGNLKAGRVGWRLRLSTKDLDRVDARSGRIHQRRPRPREPMTCARVERPIVAGYSKEH
jgi:hypothetical protein